MPATGWWARLETVRGGQRKRSFWRRAGIWWLHLLLGSLFMALGVAEVLSNASVGVAGVQLTIGAIFLASVPFAYRQNRVDLGASKSANEGSPSH